VFRDVEAACTRFDPASPLMRANAAGDDWYPVPAPCFEAIAASVAAHVETEGLFDPRILTRLERLGYDRTLPFESGAVRVPTARAGTAAYGARGVRVRTTRSVPAVVDPAALPPIPGAVDPDPGRWRPGLDPARRAVRIGPFPIDLGGIGKGLAVRWAAERLAGVAQAFLVEAGGDCLLGGRGPEGDGWKVGVENPVGGPERTADEEPVAVLSLSDTGCATSSRRRRTWQLDDAQVHHIIDPRTGRSASGGLRSVTVIEPDPARAEVWSKSLLVAGARAIGALADEHALAALWVDDGGRLATSAAMDRLVLWRADHAR
jgi:thiamine biosynthesis lipoprotein